ncbi:MAG: DUF378 domain-containing protein [Candidatus Paceibacterota bacterium]
MMKPENQKVLLQFLLTSILILGGLSWGILGMAGYNPISQITNALELPFLTRIIYTLIGLATILYIYKYFSQLSVFMPNYDETYLPSCLLNMGQEGPLNSDVSTSVKAPSGARFLAFWSHDGLEEDMNCGVSPVVDEKALIKLKSHGKTMQVYYRWVNQSKLGRIHSMTL